MEVEFRSKKEIREKRDDAVSNIEQGRLVSKYEGVQDACDWLLENYGDTDALQREVQDSRSKLEKWYSYTFLFFLPFIGFYVQGRAHYWDGFHGTLITGSNLFELGDDDTLVTLNKDKMEIADYMDLSLDDIDDAQIIDS